MRTASSPLTRLVLLLLPTWILSLPSGPATGQAPAEPSPLALAVVRIPSHGCSGTVIRTGDGWSDLLSCAHAFRGADALRPLAIDGPAQPAAHPGRHPARLAKVDVERDLSLIRIDNGPYYCVPVAPAGHRMGRRLLSVGYDEMRWPVTERTATALFTAGGVTWTHEAPWHGRSGGALFDVEGGYLVGVVQAYEVPSPHRGLYVSLATIHEFLGGGAAGTHPALPRPPPTAPGCPPGGH
jgi:hypothetical protein